MAIALKVQIIKNHILSILYFICAIRIFNRKRKKNRMTYEDQVHMYEIHVFEFKRNIEH